MHTKAVARTFASSEETLEFYDNNVGLPVAQLEPLLSQLVYLQRKTSSPEAKLFQDERFIRLLLQATSDMESCDSNTLARFSLAMAKLVVPREGCQELTELSQRIAEVCCRRVNAFSPTTLSQLALGLGTRGVTDPQVTEFLRIEATKMMQDFNPEDAILLLEGFRRMNIFNRELGDNVVERLTDDVSRFTSRDIVNCVVVFSKLGLGRGYLLRRLSNLASQNLSLFSQSQLVKLLSGFASLRFLSTEGVEGFLTAIGVGGLERLSPNQQSDALFAVAISGYSGSSTLVNQLAENVVSKVNKLNLTGQVNSAWALKALGDVTDANSIAATVFSVPPPSSKVLLLKALEVSVGLGSDVVGGQWRSAMDDAEKLEVGRFEQSRLHSEVLALIESIKPEGILSDKVALQRAVQVGPYRAELFDDKKRLVIDIDTLSRPTPLTLKHSQLSADGFATVALNYWELRRYKNFEDLQLFLKEQIKKSLRKAATEGKSRLDVD